jgi:hypothetical protein
VRKTAAVSNSFRSSTSHFVPTSYVRLSSGSSAALSALKFEVSPSVEGLNDVPYAKYTVPVSTGL